LYGNAGDAARKHPPQSVWLHCANLKQIPLSLIDSDGLGIAVVSTALAEVSSASPIFILPTPFGE
jgi:hypothetical protein